MFLRNKEWYEFQKRAGAEVLILDKKIGIYATKHNLMFGMNYLYSPYFELCHKLIDEGKKHNSIFVKCEPMEQDHSIIDTLCSNNFIESKKSIQPQKTIIVSLNKDDYAMLSKMKQKTRYNIRLALKKGVIVKKEKDINIFWQLLTETTKRSGFYPHKKEYYLHLLNTPNVYMFISFVEDKATSCAIVIKDERRIVYLHGASTRYYKEYMSPFGLHWYIMQYFSNKGLKEYDLWGVDEVKWPNVTRFKKGFGGIDVKYVGSYDFIINPLFYKLYNLKQKIKI